MTPPARFLFVVHPPEERDLQRIQHLKWTGILPKGWAERLVGSLGPFPLFKMTGIETPQGNRCEGWVMGLLSTPRLMMNRPPEATYRLLVKAAEWGAKRGATVMGLGAFTSVVGDAGITVAERSPIPVTTGNALTVGATLASLEALASLDKPLADERVAIVGATGAIGSAVARILADRTRGVLLLGKDAQKTEALAQSFPKGTVVDAGTDPRALLPKVKRVVGVTSSGGTAIPVDALAPGTAVLDVALPPDVSRAQARERPDCLFLEAGEIRLPGKPEFSYDWPLPKEIAYACEAETILISLTGRTDLCTLGREISVRGVESLWNLALDNGFSWAGFRSFGKDISRDEV